MYLLLDDVGLGTYYSSKTDQVDEVTEGLPAMISKGYQCRAECGTNGTTKNCHFQETIHFGWSTF